MATRTQNTGMKPINILKKGLAKLRNQISDQKSKLKADLKANKHISEVDEEWLDNTGNLVDEEHVVHRTETHDDSIAQAETLVQSVLDNLEKTGALQPSN